MSLLRRLTIATVLAVGLSAGGLGGMTFISPGQRPRDPGPGGGHTLCRRSGIRERTAPLP